jgi:hypothetical protein
MLEGKGVGWGKRKWVRIGLATTAAYFSLNQISKNVVFLTTDHRTATTLDRQADRQTRPDRQADRQTGRQTDTDRQTRQQ